MCVYTDVSHVLVNEEVRPTTSISCTPTACVGLLQWLRGKESTRNAGDTGDAGSVLGSGRSPRGGHDNPSSMLAWRIPWNGGAWWATVHGVTQSQI